MYRELILVPPTTSRITGGTPIGPGYPRTATPQQMRGWSDDLSRLYRTLERDRGLPVDQQQLRAWMNTPRDQLSPEARGVVDAQRKLMSDPADGIWGSLRPDGRIELGGGRHRANYILERQSDPVPVWVSAPDAQSLEQLRSECDSTIAQSRPGLLAPGRNRSPTREIERPPGPDKLTDRSAESRATQTGVDSNRDRNPARNERER